MQLLAVERKRPCADAPKAINHPRVQFSTIYAAKKLGTHQKAAQLRQFCFAVAVASLRARNAFSVQYPA